MRKSALWSKSSRVSAALCSLAVATACSGGGDDTGSTTSGGASTNGGATTYGGAATSGGAAPTSGGVATSGGTSTSGGSTQGGAASGGAAGMATSGGAVTSGGANATGGSVNGGATSGGASGGGSAGANTTGGAMATGGTSGGSASGGSGGAKGGAGGASGGTTTGGAAGSGGNAGKGGSTATGGSGCPLDLVGFATREGGTTGGGTTAPTTVTTQAELRACATATGPRVCRVQGTLTFSPFEEIEVKSDKTIIGAGANANIVMGGFVLREGVKNVIIRNLTIRDSWVAGQDDTGGDGGGDRDGVQMDTADHIWIDHVHFKHLGDGMIDSRKDTTFLTVSWNILENHNKAFGIGWTENVTAQMTIHHNWLHDTTQRNPSTDNVLRAHLFNNVMENLTSYGNYARGGTNMVLQNSVFVNVKDPHYYDTGTLVATGNVYRNTTGMREASGETFSFFDPSTFYTYSLDTAAQAETIVKRCAGPRAELGN